MLTQRADSADASMWAYRREQTRACYCNATTALAKLRLSYSCLLLYEYDLRVRHGLRYGIYLKRSTIGSTFAAAANVIQASPCMLMQCSSAFPQRKPHKVRI